MTKDLEKFKEIFEGLDCAYGQTVKTDQFSEKGKHKTKSFTITKRPIDKLWQDHLDGKDPALGIVPISSDNKCKWGCIDIDTYPFDHKKFIKKLKEKKIHDKAVFKHPLIGRIDIKLTLAFYKFHFKHHQKQINALKKQL